MWTTVPGLGCEARDAHLRVKLSPPLSEGTDPTLAPPLGASGIKSEVRPGAYTPRRRWPRPSPAARSPAPPSADSSTSWLLELRGLCSDCLLRLEGRPFPPTPELLTLIYPFLKAWLTSRALEKILPELLTHN